MPLTTDMTGGGGGGGGGGSAAATITNWDGHFTVENSATIFCPSQWVDPSDESEPHPPPGQNGRVTNHAQHSQKNGSAGLRRLQQHRQRLRRAAAVQSDTDDGDNGGNDRGVDNNNADDDTDDADIWCNARPPYRRAAKSSTASAPASSAGAGRTAGSGNGGRAPQPSTAGRVTGGLFTSRQNAMGSSVLGESMTEIRIEDVQNHSDEPTSALLDYCKRKFLRPYLGILSLVALNPISTDNTRCRSGLSYLQAILVLALLIFGYGLQYLCSYRGDRGFTLLHHVRNASLPPTATSADILPAATLTADYRVGRVRTIGELIFGHVIPNTLSMIGYVTAVVVCKMVGQEQLQNLVERSFLMSLKPKRLRRILWLHVAAGGLLLVLLFGYVVPSVLLQKEIVGAAAAAEAGGYGRDASGGGGGEGGYAAAGESQPWAASLLAVLEEWQSSTKFVLLLTLFVQDLVEIVILTSYCIECYLLRAHLETLSYKLLMHSIDSQDWMREMLEFRKLLDHLNQRVAIPVCFFTVMNLAYSFAGFVYLFNDFDFHYSALRVVILNCVNVLLWLVMGLAPFFAAASVTRACQTAQGNGHQIRVRPFVYHNTSAEDLNSTLLFASSLDMSAKLFRMPIQSNYLCFSILVVSIVVLTLGMCINLIDFGTF